MGACDDIWSKAFAICYLNVFGRHKLTLKVEHAQFHVEEFLVEAGNFPVLIPDLHMDKWLEARRDTVCLSRGIDALGVFLCRVLILNVCNIPSLIAL